LNAEFEKFVQEKEKETAEKAADEDEEKLLRAAVISFLSCPFCVLS